MSFHLESPAAMRGSFETPMTPYCMGLDMKRMRIRIPVLRYRKFFKYAETVVFERSKERGKMKTSVPTAIVPLVIGYSLVNIEAGVLSG
jgi:hypothetical protein